MRWKKALLSVTTAIVLMACMSGEGASVEAAEASNAEDIYVTEKCGYRQPVLKEVPWRGTEAVSETRKHISASERSYWTKFSGDYVYNQLSAKEKELWNALEEQCIATAVGTDTTDVVMVTFDNAEYVLSNDEIWELLAKFRFENPQYYFLTSSMTISYSGSWYQAGLEIYPEFQDGNSRRDITNAFRNQVDTWVSQVSTGQREENKVKIAHDIVAQNTVYGEVAGSNGYYLDQSAYSMVCVGQTVCAGYAQTFAMLMNAVGIECIEVTSIDHAWNLVQIHGNWYGVDVTWDDQEESLEQVIYNFYNKSNATLMQDGSHVYESMWNGILPESNYDSVVSENMLDYEPAYFSVDNNTYFKVNSNEALANCLALPIDAAGGTNLPASVTSDNRVYQVIGAGNSGGSAGPGESVGDTGHTQDTTSGMRLGEDGNWYYYTNGAIDWNYTGMALNEYGWWYFRNGQLDWNYTGMALNEYGWWYFRNGQIDWNYTGMALNEYGWWYFNNGQLDWNYTGMALNDYGWWYFRNGQLDWNYTGMALNEYGWWYFTNGQLDWGYTGMALNDYGWWYFRNGQLDWSYTGMALNEYGWWYFTNGQLDWTYTGWGYNEYGQWWFENGRIVM